MFYVNALVLFRFSTSTETSLHETSVWWLKRWFYFLIQHIIKSFKTGNLHADTGYKMSVRKKRKWLLCRYNIYEYAVSISHTWLLFEFALTLFTALVLRLVRLAGGEAADALISFSFWWSDWASISCILVWERSVSNLFTWAVSSWTLIK